MVLKTMFRYETATHDGQQLKVAKSNATQQHKKRTIEIALLLHLLSLHANIPPRMPVWLPRQLLGIQRKRQRPKPTAELKK